ncbi:hypothetical protein ZIOFF_047569 [Zingiber officinale]|uniref:Protein kinase domain-containing protein n=1 Tax=Zingiber officinale TaxID=94328 RepID=A0A8J5KWV0_ZINOF|nr:hypothetical protein ZIOFF_047569 [Zingiber officinale]
MAGRMARGKAEGAIVIWVILVYIWTCDPNLSFAFGATDPNDASALYVLFGSLNLAPQLSGWKQSGDPCRELHALAHQKLSSLGLSGTLGYNMNQMASLEELDLSNNQFGGSIPYSVSHMAKLELLNLAHNQLRGRLDDIFQGLSKLTTIKRRKNLIEENLGQDRLYAHLDSDRVKGTPHLLYDLVYVAEKEMNRISSIFDIEKLPSLPPPCLKPHHYKSFDEDDCSSKLITKKVDITSIKSTIYSVADLQIATDSFSEDNLIREGTFGHVFKAEIDDGKILAVKKLNPKSLLSKSTGDFIDLVTNISLLHHTNLTELVGYCSEYGQRMLVYDFHKNGSLYELLHLSDEPLSWNARIKIALGVARALE